MGKRYMALDTLPLVRDTSPPEAEHFSQQYLRDLVRALPAPSAAGQVPVSKVVETLSPPWKRVTECIPIACTMKCWKIYRVIGHFGMPEDWPDTIDKPSWEKFIGGEGRKGTVTRTNASIISRPFLIFTVKKARSKEGIYIYIVRCRRMNEDESISEMERKRKKKSSSSRINPCFTRRNNKTRYEETSNSNLSINRFHRRINVKRNYYTRYSTVELTTIKDGVTRSLEKKKKSVSTRNRNYESR